MYKVMLKEWGFLGKKEEEKKTPISKVLSSIKTYYYYYFKKCMKLPTRDLKKTEKSKHFKNQNALGRKRAKFFGAR
jgi:hypothetical protein